MNKKIMILGRSGSGKDTLASELTKTYGLKQLCSTTTRPRRYEGESTHVFVTEEQASSMTDRVAETIIDGYQYFATAGQFEDCDIYVIDPRGLECVCEKAKDTELCVVYVKADRDARLTRAKKRAADPVDAANVFKSRDNDENKMFTEFEDMVLNDRHSFFKKYKTAKDVIIIENNKDDMERMAKIAKDVFVLTY